MPWAPAGECTCAASPARNTRSTVSRSTFFRYFPSKEDVVLFDDVDPLMAEAFAEQPAGTPLLGALRLALRTAFGRLSPEKRELEEVRMDLVRQVPELAAAVRERGGMSVDVVATAIGEGLGLDPGALDVQLFAGVVAGARLAAQSLVDREPGRSYVDTLDAVLARLEDGIPLADLPSRIWTARLPSMIRFPDRWNGHPKRREVRIT